ncbi:MAG TPA: N-acetyltransferase [Anaerolineales bacterium]|nr:N-acetyltransferase [Anaerolineales bacterium]
MDIHIRNEDPQDIEQVREVLRAVFPSDAESRLVDALRANGKATISLVAVKGDDVLGHILFSPVTTAPPSDAKGIGLAPVAVRPEAQSQGIGSKLIQEGLRLAKELGFDYCVVLGGSKYYQRFGFEKASPFGIRNEYGVDDAFMLIRFSDRKVTGLVHYAPEFGELSV